MAGETLGFQVHHIFPVKVMENLEKFFKEAGIKPIDVDDYSNRLNLFDNQAMADVMKDFYTKNSNEMDIARFFGSVAHNNKHQGYSDFVEMKLRGILADSTIDAPIKEKLIFDLHQQLVIAMKEGHPPINGTSADDFFVFFDGKNLDGTIPDNAPTPRLASVNDFMSNTARSQQVAKYQENYFEINKIGISNNGSVKEDFSKIVANIDLNSKVYDVPYSQITINSIKKALASNSSSDMRIALAQMVYDEADKANLIVTKTAIQQFQEMVDDDPNKEFLADKISKNPNVPLDVKNEAAKYLSDVNILQDTIVKNGFGDGFGDLAEIQNIKDINPEFAKRLIKEANFAQRFNIAANVTDFLNHVYDSFIEGWKTGNWDKFRDDIAEYGQEIVLSIVVGYVVIAGLTAMAAVGVVGAKAALIAAAVAGVAATLYGIYELYQKVRDTDFNELIDITKQNFKELFEDNKDWLLEQSQDVISGLADILTQFDKWGEKNALTELLKDYKEVLGEKENSKEAFKYLKQQYDANTKFMGTEEDDKLINTTKEGDHILYGGKGDDSLIGNDKMDILIGGAGDDTLDGKEGNDILGGNDGNDTLNGGKGNDYLHGGEGDDTLDGGTGRDVLIGGIGKDNYEFSENFGHDTIDDRDGQGVIRIDNQILQAGERITGDRWYSSDKSYIISASKVHESDTTYVLLVQAVGDNSKSITIKDWRQNDLGLTLAGLGQPQEQPAINEWTVGNADNNIITRKQYVNALDGNDWVFGTANDDVVLAGAGRDLIALGDGNDIIYSGVKEGVNDDDLIFAGEGEDVIHSGAGDDVIFSSSVMYWSNNGLSQTIKDMGEDSRNIPQEQKRYSNQIGWDISYDKAIEFPSNDAYYYADTHHNLPIIKAYYVATAKDNKKLYLFNNIRAITNDGYGYQGADLVYAGAGNDMVVGSSDGDILYGEQGKDTLFGLDGHDVLYGGEGHDALYGGDGLDLLIGGDDDDHLVGGVDDDKLYGGSGDDHIQGDLAHLRTTNLLPESAPRDRFGNDYLDGGEGDDVMVGSIGNDKLYGGTGNDELVGDASYIEGEWHGQDYLDGGEGDDKLWGLGGDDTLYGGDGNDGLSGDYTSLDGQYHGSDYLDGGKGKDNLWGHGGGDTLYGGEGDDELSGDNVNLDGQYHGDDYLDGGEGNDKLWGDGGNDILYGGNGNDELAGDDNQLEGKWHGQDYLDGGEGDDKLQGDGGNDTLYGGNGDDELAGDNMHLAGEWHGQDRLEGGEGDDRLWGYGGNDTLYGGSGDDYLEGDYHDMNEQYHGDDMIDGGSGNDILIGLGGNDTLYGGSGDDILDGGSGDDIMIGGAGNDTYYVDSLSDTIIESGDEGLDIVYASIDYTLDDGNHIDVLKLTGMALVGIGNNLDNSIVGNQFDNILEGGGGNDFLIATQGADILDGGIGDDIYHFDTKALNDGLTKTIKDSDLTGVIRINGQDLTGQNLRLIGYNATTQEYTWVNEQGYQIRKDSQGYTISSDDFSSHILIATDSQAGNILGLDIALPPKPLNPIEAKNYLTLGTLGDDIITVNDDKAHSINGFMGDDIIYGGSQNDILNGEIGNDVIFGGQGNDKLYGGLGSDVLNGGQGDDYLDGSYGNDTYVFKLGDGQDIIKDISGSDTLDLSDFLFDDLIVTKQSGNLVIKFKSDTAEQNSITIQNWDNPAYQIEKIVLADTIINNIQLTNIIG